MPLDYFDKLPNPVFICDKKGKVLEFNLEAKTLLPEIEVGVNIDQFIVYEKLENRKFDNFSELCASIEALPSEHQSVDLHLVNDKQPFYELSFRFLDSNQILIQVICRADTERRISTLSYKQSISDNVLSHIDESIIGFTQEGYIEYMSQSAERLFNVTLEEASLEEITIFFSENDHKQLNSMIEDISGIDEHMALDLSCVDALGRVFPASTVWWRSIVAELEMYFVHISDLTMMKTFMEEISGAFVRVDEKGQIFDNNANTENLFGMDMNALKQYSLSKLNISLPDSDAIIDSPVSLIKIEKDQPIYISTNKKMKKVCEISVWPQQTQAGKVYNIILHDITEKKKQEALLHDAAYKDFLTGLYNRQYLMEYLEEKLETYGENRYYFALMMIDLDGFKLVNDTQGHAVGDALLKHVAIQLENCVRDQGIVARLGGDEFVIILEGLTRVGKLQELSLRIISSIESIAKKLDISTTLSCSIGISCFPKDTTDINELIKFADLAMYQSKESGKRTYHFFDKARLRFNERKTKIKEALNVPIKPEEFSIVYQPKIKAPDLCIYGVEALIRWDSGELGKVGPNDFISVAEESRAITEIDRWVTAHVMKQCKNLLSSDSEISTHIQECSINISAIDLNSDLYDHIEMVINETSTDPTLIDIEITESSLTVDFQESVRILHRLKGLGVKISVDNFGTGYASLQYLKEFPLDNVKIDRHFIQNIHQSDKNRFMVEAIHNIATNINVGVIAAGVETEEERDCLLNIGVDKFQGFLFSKPLPADELIAYIKKNA